MIIQKVGLIVSNYVKQLLQYATRNSVQQEITDTHQNVERDAVVKPPLASAVQSQICIKRLEKVE